MKNAKLEIFKEDNKPRALIFGGPKFLREKLSEKLKEKGCLVSQGFKDKGVFDYGFLFKEESLENILREAGQKFKRFIVVFPLNKKISLSLEEKIFSSGGRILKISPPKKETADLLVDNLLPELFKEKGVKTLVFSPPPSKAAPFFLFLLLAIIFIGGVVFLPPLYFSFNFYQGFSTARALQRTIQAANWQETKENLKTAKAYFLKSRKTLFLTKTVLSFFGQGALGDNLERILSLTDSFVSAGDQTVLAGEMIKDLGEKIASGEEITDESLILLGRQFDFLDKELSFILAQVKTIDPQKMPVGQEELGKINKEAANYQGFVRFAKNGLALLPEVLGFYGRRTYLILLQNNMELRPTGGFIGSFGLLTLEKGKITDFKIEDTYDADGQMKGHVDPPPPIKKYLDQPHWFLRDSNFDPDFSQSSQKAEWFLDKEIKVGVDGVLGVDLYFVKEIIGAFGEIYLPDYDVSLNRDNFFFKTQEIVQRDFFPGSTQKKDFLGSLTRTIFLRLEEGESLPMVSLLSAVRQGFEEKHLQVFLNQASAQELTERFGWAGKTSLISCPSSASCFPDYLMVVEANLGVNKANYFVSREIEKEVAFTPNGDISTRLTINYKNESSNEEFPVGRYKNYLRVYLPPKTTLTKVLIDDGEVKEEETDKEETEGGTVYGIFLEVAVLSKKKISFEFRLPGGESWETYQLLVQKQAGTLADPLTLKISYPQNWQPVEANFSPVKKEGLLTYLTDTRVDRIFRIKFKR